VVIGMCIVKVSLNKMAMVVLALDFGGGGQT